MRKHQRYERVSNKVITVQMPCMTPRSLMDMISKDVEPVIHQRKAMYGQGGESAPIPRTMDISRFHRMADRPNAKPVPAPAPAHAPAPAPAPAPAE